MVREPAIDSSSELHGNYYTCAVVEFEALKYTTLTIKIESSGSGGLKPQNPLATKQDGVTVLIFSNSDIKILIFTLLLPMYIVPNVGYLYPYQPWQKHVSEPLIYW